MVNNGYQSYARGALRLILLGVALLASHAVLAQVRPLAAPTQVNVDLVSVPGGMLVSWLPVSPENSGNTPITGYRVIVGINRFFEEACLVSADVRYCTIPASKFVTDQVYEVRVEALNNQNSRLRPGIIGDEVSESVFVTPGFPPLAAPQNINVRVNNNNNNNSIVIIDFEQAPSFALPPILGYSTVVTRDGDSKQFICSASCQLLAGDYVARVRAFNSIGNGPFSDPVSFTIRTVPPVHPNNIRADLDTVAGGIVVTWQAVAEANNGNSPITSYRASILSVVNGMSDFQICQAVSTCIFENLIIGAPYLVLVSAENAIGRGPTGGITVTPSIPPTAPPTDVSTEATVSGVVVSWMAVSPEDNGGSPIIGYTATATAGQDSALCRAFVPAATCTISASDLTAGVAYQVQVTADNARGAGIKSAAVAVTPIAAPTNAPTEVAADLSTQPGSISVSWDALSPSAAEPIDGYMAEAMPTGGGSALSCRVNGVSATNCRITGITGNIAYEVRVYAFNRAGAGTASASITTATALLEGVPTAAPTGLSIDQDTAPGSMIIIWEALPPTSDGGAPIVRYVVDAASLNFTTASASCMADAPAVTCTIAAGDLVQGAAYRVRVRAENSVGSGPISDPDIVIVPTAPLAGPTDVQVSSSLDVGLIISWAALAIDDNGGAPVIEYVATAIAADGTSAMCIAPAPATTCTIDASELAPAQYQVHVRAFNVLGQGPVSQPLVPGIFAAPPAAPKDVTIELEERIVISWAAVAEEDNGGLPVTEYIVDVVIRRQEVDPSLLFLCTNQDRGASRCIENVTLRTSSLSLETILELDAFYAVRVRAVNLAGEGPPSQPVTRILTLSDGSFRPFGRPTEVEATSSSEGEITISWTADRFAHLDALTNHVAEAVPATGDALSCMAVFPSSACTINGADADTAYVVRVRARNETGFGPYSDPITFGEKETIPTAAPASVKVDLMSVPGGMVISWDEVAEDGTGNLPILDYTATVRDDSSVTAQCTVASTSCTIAADLLEAYTEYQVRVFASNGEGDGPDSEPVTAVPGVAPLVAPDGISVDAQSVPGDLIVHWNALTPSPSIPIEGYVAEAITFGNVLSCRADGAAANNCIISSASDLAQTRVFLVRVHAFNPAGEGLASEQVVVSAPGPPTAAPLNINVATNSASLPGGMVISWLPPPPEGGGEAVTGYTAIATADGVTSAMCTATAPAVTCMIAASDLTEGIEYQVRVRATNEHGTGPESPPSTAIPGLTPTAPDGVVVDILTHPGNMIVFWIARTPSSTEQIDGYVVEAKSDLNTLFCRVGANVSGCELTNVLFGTTYQVSVSAFNRSGSSALPNQQEITIPTAPTMAPQFVNSGFVGGQLIISWELVPPEQNGGSPITSYVATIGSQFDVFSVLGRCTVPATARKCAITMPDLSPQRFYQARVRAFNAYGAGSVGSRNFETGIINSPFAAPTDVNIDLETQPGGMVISWNLVPSANNGGLPITGYIATATALGRPTRECTVSDADATTCTIIAAELAKGVEYQVVVRARNSRGPGSASLPMPATPHTKPTAAPTNIEVDVSAFGDLVVSWVAVSPDGNGGLRINGYTATATATEPGLPFATCTAAIPLNTCTIIVGDLALGVAYRVNVQANSARGAGPKSQPETVTSVSIPYVAPANISVDLTESGGMVISWTAVAGNDVGSSPITGYTATARAGSEIVSCTAGALETSCTIEADDVNQGTVYGVVVRARNSVGEGPSSAPVSVGVPGVPTAAPGNVRVDATTTEGALQVSWTLVADANNGGAAIIGYTATATGGGATARCTAGATETSCTINAAELSAGVEYAVVVQAENARGLGSASTALPATPLLPPSSAPGGVNVDLEASPGSIVVAWNELSASAARPVSGYRAVATPGGVNAVLTCTADGVATTTCTIDSAVSGVVYQVQVLARNSVGEGPLSAPVSAGVPEVPTAAPGNVRVDATTTEGALQVSWTLVADANNGGAAITGYTATATGDGASVRCTAGASETSCTINAAELSAGVDYAVMVQASNTFGLGVSSAVLPATPILTPANAPSGVSVDVQTIPRSIVVTWTALTTTAARPVDGYRAVATPDGGGSDLSCPVTGATTDTCTIGSAVSGVVYQVRVHAFNEVGDGLASTALPTRIPGPPDSAPTEVSVDLDATPGGIVVSWTAVADADNGGSAITAYTATASAGGATRECTAPGASATTCTIAASGLTRGVTYQVTVQATNSFGNSPVSSPAVLATPSVEPTAAPTDVDIDATTTAGALVVSWTLVADANNGGAGITGYTATATAPEGVATARCTAGASRTRCTINAADLSVGVEYAVVVQAENARGLGVASTALQATPIVTPNIAPSGVSVDVQTIPRSIVVTWTALTTTAARPVDGYRAVATPDGGGSDLSCLVTGATTATCTIGSAVSSETYQVRVHAFNGVGSGPSSAPVSAGVPEVPTAAPGNVRVDATTTEGALQVSWTLVADANNGGAAITGYTATATGDGASVRCTAGASETSCTINAAELSAGVDYAVVVQASNTFGLGVSSAVLQATPILTPANAPSGVSVDVQTIPRSIVVAWTELSGSVARPVDGYRAVATPDGGGSDLSCSAPGATTTTCRIDSAVSGVVYQVRVHAFNEVGDGLASTALPTRIPGPPDTAPTEVSVDLDAVSGGIVVSWTAVADANNGGSPITSYTATATAGDGTTEECTESGASATTCTITGLTLGVPYQVTVLATNKFGVGLASSELLATPSVVPAAPTNVVINATVTPRALVVSWTAVPASANGGLPVLDYTATATAGDGTTEECTESGASATTCTITGLTAGEEYDVVVQARNARGRSPVSSAVSATPSVAPTVAPTDVDINATTTAGALVVSWTLVADANNGGAEITGYTATATATGGGATARCTAGASETSCTINAAELSAGVDYAVVVQAENALGPGVASTGLQATPIVTPNIAPSGVSVDVQTIPRSIVVTWTALTTTAARPVDGYRAVATPDGGGSDLSCSALGVTTATCTIGSAVSGETYQVRVHAFNEVGDGPASAPPIEADIPAPPTAAPTDVDTDATTTAGALVVSWTAVADANNGGSPITSYTATATADSETTRQCTAPGASATTCTIAASGLTLGVPYQVTVLATNKFGVGLASSELSATPSVVPAAPTNVVINATVTPRALVVSWMAVPASANGGLPVLDYTATATAGDGTTEECTESGASATTCTITGLTAGEEYDVVVQARNARGRSPVSSAVLAIPSVAPTAAPTDVAINATTTAGALVVRWTLVADANNGGAEITGYTATATATGDGASVRCTAGAAEISCTINATELSAGVEYSVVVQASNALGLGVSSAVLQATPILTPAAPDGVSVDLETSPGNIVVAWTALSATAARPVSGYRAVATPGGGNTVLTCTADDVATTTCRIDSAVSGLVYQVRVHAFNEVGDSPEADAVEAQIPSVPSVAPGGISVDLDTVSGGIVVSWTAVADANNGGSAITAYTATASVSSELDATCTAGASETSCTVAAADLRLGEAYQVVVEASNNFGVGPASSELSATPSVVPVAAPTDVAIAETAEGALQVSWTLVADANNGGAAITGYTATATGGVAPVGCTAGAAETSCTINAAELSAGVEYTVVVQAENAPRPR